MLLLYHSANSRKRWFILACGAPSWIMFLLLSITTTSSPFFLNLPANDFELLNTILCIFLINSNDRCSFVFRMYDMASSTPNASAMSSLGLLGHLSFSRRSFTSSWVNLLPSIAFVLYVNIFENFFQFASDKWLIFNGIWDSSFLIAAISSPVS